ncbi:MAG: hypothetical protein JW771_01740 [Candidatus Thermoplasmatota archaeon]|nr:hypothetical protein [Candidatus Thermoplasmatota archaeon]
MAYLIFEVKKEESGKIIKIIKEDIVSRQSITTRDASSLEMKGEATYLKIEGSDAGLKKAEEIAKDLGLKKMDKKKATEVNERINAQDDSAASGMGMIFD